MALRRRLIWSLIGMVVLTVLAVGAASAFLLDRSLRSRLVNESLTATEFNLAVLAPAVDLPEDPSPSDLAASGLLDRFLLRGPDGVTAEFDDGTLLSAGVVPPPPSRGLADIVDAGEIGYEFVQTPDGPVLITGARLPPDGPRIYFLTSAEPLTAATTQLAAVLGGSGILAIALGGVVAMALARRMLRPVEAARQAAETMAAGDLDVVVPVEGNDEFARLSSSFNQMAGSLRRTILELDAARDRQRRFIADASHELRTPLTGLANSATLLAERVHRSRNGGQDLQELQYLAAMMETEVRRLQHLVDDLLELSRLDSDLWEPDLAPTDLAALLRSLAALRHPDAELDVRLETPVSTDRRAIERIVGNLLDNARLHAPGAPVVLRAHLDGQWLTISVTDGGPGVSQDDLERIFERFTSGDSSRTGGTGLGLAIVSQHAARLGGTVHARPAPGGGLEVTLRTPVGELLHGGDGPETSGIDAEGSPNRGAPS